MTEIEYAHERANAIREYSTGRNGWIVLGLGSVGTLGAVRIRDGHGEEGLVVQNFEGADAGSPRCNLAGYLETKTFV